MQRNLLAAALLCLALAETPVAAGETTVQQTAISNSLSNIEQIHIAKLLRQPTLAQSGNPSLRAPLAAPIMPQRLAKSLPASAAQQQAAAREYAELLDLYRRAMRAGGLPDDDIGIALGAFIVANYQIASDSSVDDESSKATYLQMQRLVGTDAALQKLDNASRQALFEELAIMAMNMETIFEQAWEQGERAALERAQPAARQYLQAVLQQPYHALRFTANGMTLAER